MPGHAWTTITPTSVPNAVPTFPHVINQFFARPSSFIRPAHGREGVLKPFM